ncbi:MAG: hypothetical protein GX188_00120 [Syntrophomonadaceae bacterium]|nr:hypothetical protein [Syntrophomonadaceae bacterium]HAF17990.1 hypothetical protein [Peptococcaceae bacterium]
MRRRCPAPPLHFIHTHIEPIAPLPNCAGVVCNNKAPGRLLKTLPRPVLFEHCSQVEYSRQVEVEGVIVYFPDPSSCGFFQYGGQVFPGIGNAGN